MNKKRLLSILLTAVVCLGITSTTYPRKKMSRGGKIALGIIGGGLLGAGIGAGIGAAGACCSQAGLGAGVGAGVGAVAGGGIAGAVTRDDENNEREERAPRRRVLK